jgi:hypothetical protein
MLTLNRSPIINDARLEKKPLIAFEILPET